MRLHALLDGLGAVTVEGGADPDVHGAVSYTHLTLPTN